MFDFVSNSNQHVCKGKKVNHQLRLIPETINILKNYFSIIFTIAIILVINDTRLRELNSHGFKSGWQIAKDESFEPAMDQRLHIRKWYTENR